jgi:hypothetical protein
MKSSLPLASVTLSVVLALVGCAQTPSDETSPAKTAADPLVLDQTEEISATVRQIDKSSRTLLLANDAGDSVPLVVGPEVKNFDQIQVGDRVVVRYYDAIAFEVKPPGQAATATEADVAEVRAKPGERPAAAVGATVRTSVTIEGVDKSRNTVTFRREDGVLRVIDVVRPESQEFIKHLKPGDQVEVTYTEALAVSVEPAM